MINLRQNWQIMVSKKLKARATMIMFSLILKCSQKTSQVP